MGRLHEDMVDKRPITVPRDSLIGDLPGQWSEEFRRDEHPKVLHLEHNYDDEVDVTNAEMKYINGRLQRSKKLLKYDIVIKPKRPRGR